jgi:hypothetical protein
MRRFLYAPINPKALEQLTRRANHQRRTPQNEAALLLERALEINDRPGERANLREPADAA